MMMKKVLVENQYGHGAVKINKVRRLIRKKLRSKVAMAANPVDWSTPHFGKNLKIKNQYSSFSCGGQAGSYFLELQGNEEISAKSIYAPVAYPGGGTTVAALEKQIASLGENTEATVPSYYITGTTDEAFMTDKSWISPQTTKDAITRAGFNIVNVDIDIESMAQAIRDYNGIIIEIQGQNNGTWLSPYPKPPTSNNSLWAHFMCGKGYGVINGVKQIDCFQSWGDKVGDQGIQHFTEEYINSGYIIDCFTFAKKVPAPAFTSQMNYGSMGNQVYLLQRKLLSEGVATFIEATGFFGNMTVQSVKNYQKKYGIVQTGNVGPLTLAQLNKS